MIAKEKSQKIKQLKYLLLIPLLAGMLFYTSCIDEVNEELFEMESALNNVQDFRNGKYFDFEIGKTYVGNSLMIGRYLDVSEYTVKEKEITEKFNSNDELLFDHVVLLDENNVRVNWFRPKSARLGSKSKYEYVEGDDVPFAVVEEVPVFPGCEGTKEELRLCLQENITKHVNRNFNASLASDLGLTAGVKRIFVIFKIDKEGNISDAMARAPHKSLEDEAIRVVQSLPKMMPGKYNGNAVGVKYSLPIAFKVGGEQATNEQSKKAKEDFINGNKTDTVFEVVKGKITNENGKGLPGTNIVIKGTDNGVVTDYDGNFAIRAMEEQILIISFIDDQTQEVKIGKERTINIVLKKNNT